MTLRVGIISANWGTFAHLPAWRSLEGVEVVAVCTSRQETAQAAAAKHGLPRAYWDAQEMIASPDIDIIDCGTRPVIRHEMLLSALKQGKHIYNAIPFATDYDKAQQLNEARKGSKSVVVSDAYSEWLPAFRTAREMLDDNHLGQPFGGTAIFDLSLFNAPHPMFPYNWFSQGGQGVSAVRNLGSHALHMLIFLFGEIDEVIATDAQLLPQWTFPDGSKIKVETNDYCNALIRFTSGMVMQFQISWSATVGRGLMIDAFGSNGRMVISDPSFPTWNNTLLEAGKVGERTLAPVGIPDRFKQPPELKMPLTYEPQASMGMAMTMHSMIETIRGKAQAAPDFDKSFYVERVQEAIRRASAERRWVKLDEIN